ncbi:MAG: hypothetical protein JXN65_01820 [Clostridia bacterium]|nr:hypothetical protein [Clostridia bacterium]
MENKKTFNLKKTVIAALTASVILTVLVYLTSLTLGRFTSTLLEDKGAAWYYWKLPEASLWATITAWGLYAAHQITAWYLVYKISKQPQSEKGKASRLNVIFLVVNAVFILLHIAQTMLFYDGLAQQVPVMSSQGSVIVMLVMILILMNSRRGIFFGKKVKLPKEAVGWVFKSHGFYIAWAVVYTFWFHPAEGTLGHLMGFFYLFMLFTQMSLAGTRFHNDTKWVTVLEVYVAVHGAIVAIEAANGMWPMFFFGFMMMFVVTALYGLTKKKGIILAISIAYILLALLVFSGVLGNDNTLADIHQVTWIPIILYALVFVLIGLYQAAYLLFGRKQKKAELETDN